MKAGTKKTVLKRVSLAEVNKVLDDVARATPVPALPGRRALQELELELANAENAVAKVEAGIRDLCASPAEIYQANQDQPMPGNVAVQIFDAARRLNAITARLNSLTESIEF